MKVCAFDFDGTLIEGDSIKLFCRWVCYNYFEFVILYHFVFRILFFFNNSQVLKFKRIYFFYKLFSKRKKNIENFTEILIKNEFKDTEGLINENSKLYKLVIISASFKFILEDYASRRNIDLIANETFNYEQDINGMKKILALDSQIKRKDYRLMLAYGNSPGDYPMLDKAERAYLRKSNGILLEWQK